MRSLRGGWGGGELPPRYGAPQLKVLVTGVTSSTDLHTTPVFFVPGFGVLAQR